MRVKFVLTIRQVATSPPAVPTRSGAVGNGFRVLWQLPHQMWKHTN